MLAIDAYHVGVRPVRSTLGYTLLERGMPRDAAGIVDGCARLGIAERLEIEARS